ncbi:MAG: phosphoenolpyruvate--protein phosphotransferase [Treponema sp.]|jgi:phosphotransferase system enzyme I (PtsI)|nr:phosphoenolpyruvate--protein phosphotransferase [Treponema sp.]
MKKLKGVPGSSGIVIGKAFLHLEKELPEIARYSIRKNQIPGELKRLRDATEEAMTEIRFLMEKANREMGKEHADIFAAHLMMLEDMDFREQVSSRIRKNLENIEWVVYDTARQMMQKMLSSPDPHFRERAVDINDISHRILGKLLFIKKISLADLDRDVILVVHDLLPSEVLTMNRQRVKGIVMDMGGSTSHTAILARAFEIPAVLGLSSASSEINNDDTLILNAAAGEIFVNPDEKELEKWERVETRYHKKLDEFLRTRDLSAETKDGYRVSLKANIEVPEEADGLHRFGAEGIGLYRSEFLFLNPDEAADEELQLHSYNQVLKAMGKLPVTIRTVDLGGDKILHDFFTHPEKNPLLGWRAIRFSLSLPDLFKTQLRAILRSSVNGNVKIMFPLISGLEELDAALAVLEESKAECRKKGQPFADNIEVGTMIEVPSAAMIADILAKRSDFFSIGTNDLVQYSMAVDRGNEKVSYLAQPTHPAILRFLKTTIEAAHNRGIKAAMCGEMAGDPGMTVLLLGLGLDEFSMAASSIPLVKRIIREVTISACRELAGELINGVSFMANNALMKAWMTERFPKD